MDYLLCLSKIYFGLKIFVIVFPKMLLHISEKKIMAYIENILPDH